MKKQLLTFAFSAFIATSFFAQAAEQISDAQIIAIAHQRGIADVDIPGFIQHYKNSPSNSEVTQRNIQPAAPLFILNSGFEFGNFTCWQGAIGDNTVNSTGPLQNIQVGIFSTTPDALVNEVNARHTILDSLGGTDPSGGFPVVPPGLGIYTARMGGTTANYQGEILEQTFVVSANQPYLKINYAVVLNDGGHLAGESPYFKYVLEDSLQNSIATRYDEIVNNPPGYILSQTTASTYYLPWQSDSISLVNYIGHTLKLSFTTAGCIYSGHFGYCYVDVFDAANLASVNEINSTSFSIYPNPGNGIFNIAMTENNSVGQPIITDVSGRIVNAAITKANSGWQIDMRENATGIYFVRINTANGFSVKQLIVE
jgi:hypothetical protein